MSFLKHSGVQHPIICGAMYPCSNPELIAAASDAGGLGIIQPLSLTYVHGHDLREGIQKIRGLTQKPVGFNLIVEQSVKIYQKRMEMGLDVALSEGIRFFITALGNPDWVIKKVKAQGGVVYHDVTELKYALKVKDLGVSGLICVNNRAGGHAGTRSPQELYDELKDLGLPLICAGGVGSREEYRAMLALGYQGVQMGTRFIATTECTAHEEYKRAILKAKANDIVMTTRVTGVPLAVIKTAFVEKVGLETPWLVRRLLQGRKTKHWVRLYYSLRSIIKLKKSNFKPLSTKDFWQAGKSVEKIDSIVSARQVIADFVK